jgi:hypothetical protein
MTKTEALKAGLLVDGWTPIKIARTGARAYTKMLPYKDSTDTYQAWCWVGGGATLRISRDDCKTHSAGTPKRCARMIALGEAKASPANLLADLDAL